VGERMQYSQPAKLDDAVAALAADAGAKCLAGGATLVAQLNWSSSRPTHLVSLQDIAELKGMTPERDGQFRIGAMASHATVAKDMRLTGGLALVREAASQIAHPAIRNMATIGGSLAEADPNSDYPCALLGAGAEIEIAGPKGRRICSIDEFFRGDGESALVPGDVIVAIKLPACMPGEGSKYLKYSRVDGDYATVSVAVRLRWENGACAAIRISLGSCAPTPFRVSVAEKSLEGTVLDDAALNEVGEAYRNAADPVSDFKGSGEFRRLLIPGLLSRAVKAARGAVR
jgi:carbon-monoxide dehydrogenase medium subunit